MAIDGRREVWALLIQRGIDTGTGIELFWRKDDAAETARAYVAAAWPSGAVALPSGAHEAIEAYNGLAGGVEHLVIVPVPVSGHQFFEGDNDTRPRCTLCREPLELADDDDPESWIHAEDANYFGDHTAAIEQ